MDDGRWRRARARNSGPDLRVDAGACDAAVVKHRGPA
jgi:hypothetical protein